MEDRIHDLAVAYNHAAVLSDPAQMIGSMQRLRARGLSVAEHTFSAASNTRLALRLLELVRAHRIVLPDIDELVDEFTSVRITERQPGVFRVDTTGAGHDDQVIACGMLAVAFATTSPDIEVPSSVEELAALTAGRPDRDRRHGVDISGMCSRWGALWRTCTADWEDQCERRRHAEPRDLKAIEARGAMDGQRLDDDRERADACSVPRSSGSRRTRARRRTTCGSSITRNLGDAGGEWCCWRGCRDDLVALATACGVDFDPETGHWECQNWPFFPGVAIRHRPGPGGGVRRGGPARPYRLPRRPSGRVDAAPSRTPSGMRQSATCSVGSRSTIPDERHTRGV